jgi:integrase
MEDIKKKIDKYAINTQKTMYISIVACLCLYPSLKKLCGKFREIMMEMNKSYRIEAGKNEKSDKQKDAWLEWEEVEKIHDELAEKVDNLSDKKNLTESQYNLVLKLMVLSLYTMVSVRRNRDYQFMNIVKSSDGKSKDVNYLDMDKQEFIFNIYKTAKTQGQSILKIPNELMGIVKHYLLFHPTINKITKDTNEPFLVYHNGKDLHSQNSITRILNSIFAPKKISSSMLRHIFITSRFGKEMDEMKKVAEEMGHSQLMQQEYMKK